MNERSRLALRAIDSDGELPMSARQQIFAALDLEISEAAALEAFARVECLCAEKTAAIWLDKFDDDREPIDLLRNIVTSVPRSFATPATASALDRLKRKLDDGFGLGQEYVQAIYAGFAYWAAAQNWVYPVDLASLTSEFDSEPEEWTAAFMASLAISGGAVWEQGVWEQGVGDAALRRAYWIWYVETCDAELAARSLAR